jgi:hypothetical protein
MKNPDPLINAKLKSKAHLINTFFDFVVPYLPGFASKYKKGKCDQNFFLQNIKIGIKNAEFHADLKSVKKVGKKCTKNKL